MKLVQNIARIRMVLQQPSQVTKLLESLISKTPETKASIDLYTYLAKAYEQMKNWPQARHTYNRYINTYKASRTKHLVHMHLSLAQSYQKDEHVKARIYASKELDQAVKIYQSLDKKEQNDPHVKHAISMVYFLKAEHAQSDFLTYKLVLLSQRTLVKTLHKKFDLHEECEKAYLNILKLKLLPVNIYALYSIANLHYTFFQVITQTKPTPALQKSEELLDVFQIFMEEKSIPLRKKAEQSTQTALKIGARNST